MQLRGQSCSLNIRVNSKFLYETFDGSYIDVENKEEAKQYVVIVQSISPNTEVKSSFEVNPEGNEYSYLVEQQSYKEIDLYVKPVK